MEARKAGGAQTRCGEVVAPYATDGQDRGDRYGIGSGGKKVEEAAVKT